MATPTATVEPANATPQATHETRVMTTREMRRMPRELTIEEDEAQAAAVLYPIIVRVIARIKAKEAQAAQ